jgi:nucleoside-diphosphate-sugar epimerase
MPSCTITGADGFIGRALVPFLSSRNWTVHGWRRRDNSFVIPAGDVPVEAIIADWSARLRGVDAVVHLAGLAHQLGDAAERAASQYDAVNARGAQLLAQAAADAGVRRFVFVSTAKVFGEGGATYRPDSKPAPADLYARSKWLGEQRVRAIAERAGMEWVVVRPPLVYGPGVSANFARLQRLAALPLPLPIASLPNRRDMIALPNLLTLIATCLEHTAAANQVWLCGDAQPYSLADIVSSLRAGQGRRPGVFRFPPGVVRSLVRTVFGADAAHKLLGDFQVDWSETQRVLGWSPAVTMQQAMSGADITEGATT